MQQEVNTIEEAEAIVNPLLAENKWAITVVHTIEDKYIVKWMEHKMYTAHDGKEYLDEVWTTAEGEMKLIQDLEPEHARNIIRMILRQEREYKQMMEGVVAAIAQAGEAYNEEDDGENNNLFNSGSTPTILH